MNPIYGSSIRQLYWANDQTMTATLASMDLTASQGHILAYIAHSPQPPCPRDMEEAFRLSHPTVSGLLSRLEKKGFIRIAPDPTDRRCKRVSLEKRGVECMERMEATIAASEAKLVQNFTEEEKQLFAGFLRRAITNLGGSPRRTPFCKEESE